MKGYGPLDAGVALLALLLPFTTSAIVAGRIVTRFNNYRWIIYGGWLIASTGSAMLIAWPLNDSDPMWAMTFIIGGIGQGALLNAQSFAAQALCKVGDEGAAAAMFIFSRQFGMAMGVGLGATIFQNAMALQLGWLGLPTDIAYHADSFIETLHALPHGPYRDALYESYDYGFQILFATWLGLGLVMFLMTLLLVKQVDMNRVLGTDHQLESERIQRHWGPKG
jgi:MFS family permease